MKLQKKKVEKMLTWILVVVVSVVFIWAFTIQGDMVSRSRSYTVGTVNGKPVVKSQESKFTRLAESQVKRYREQYGEGEIDENVYYQLEQGAFQQMALQMLMMNYAKKNKVYVSEMDIINAVKQQYFLDENGQFKQNEWQYFVNNGAQTVKKEFQDDAENILTLSVLNGATLFSHFPISKQEIEYRLKIRGIKKRALVGWFDAVDEVYKSVNDEDLKAFFDQNRSQYGSNVQFEQIKEQVRYGYVQANYSFISSQVIAQKKLEIQSLLSNANNSAGFNQVIKTAGLKVYETDMFHFFSENLTSRSGEELAMLPFDEIKESLLNTKKGEISDVMELRRGLCVAFVLDEEKPDSVSPSSFFGKKLEEEVTEKHSREVMIAYQQYLMGRAKVEFTVPVPEPKS